MSTCCPSCSAAALGTDAASICTNQPLSRNGDTYKVAWRT